MTLVGVKCRHAWLDHNMNVVGYPPIQNEQAWKSSNTNDNLLLGQAVHAVVQHLQLQPPEVLEITDAGLQRLQQQQQTTTNGGVTRRRGSSATTAPPDYNTLFEAQLPTFPSIPTEFHVLQTKSREELRRLLNTESEFRTFLTSTTTYTQTQTLALSTIEENAQVAAANLEEEEKLKTLHASVTASQTSLKTKLSEYEKQEREYHSLTAPPSSKTVMKQLQKAKRQAFEESEELADKWVDSDTAADEMSDFLERFLETRQVHHVRAAKLERLQQQEGGGHLSSSR
jgi:ESCRT-I complex subunit VPS37